MRIISLAVFISLLTALEGRSQTVEFGDLEKPKLDKKQELLLEMENLEKVEKADFAKALENLSSEISRYAQTRKKECMGEYSSLEITPEGEKKTYKNKLSKEEKKLCLLELIKLRKSFSNSLFNIRKKLLLQQHQRQLENLERLRDESLKELDSMASQLK